MVFGVRASRVNTLLPIGEGIIAPEVKLDRKGK